MTRRDFCNSLAVGGLGALGATALPHRLLGDAANPFIVTPTPQQMAWQDLELGMFIHFDMWTYTGKGKPRTPADPNLYNPTNLDTDQWLAAAKAMGAKYAVFVAKHCTGFLSWQSDAYPYGVKQSSWRNGKGDVVQDFVDSCRKFGIKPGLYASVTSSAWWGIDNPGVIKWGDKKQEDYVKACEVMLTELWSRYGELVEVWFDGGMLSPEHGGPNLLPILAEHQPNAVTFHGPPAAPNPIRWSGNETGFVPYPCWARMDKHKTWGKGYADGIYWRPVECDAKLPGDGWFWHGKAAPRTPSDAEQERTLTALMDMYYRSVGRNANLLLNATPDITGLIPEVNLPHYTNFGKEIARRFDTPVAETNGEGETVELRLEQPARIDHVIVMEDIAHGERIRAYEIEGLVPGNTWQKLCDGISVGHKRIQQFEATEVAAVRVRATQSVATPKIRNLSVFNVG